MDLCRPRRGESNEVVAPEVTDRGMVIAESQSPGGEARGVAKRIAGSGTLVSHRKPDNLFSKILVAVN